MAILPILLYPPSDHYGGDRFDGFCAQIFNDVLFGIIEYKVVGCECLDDIGSQRVGVHIYYLLVLLSIFAQTWTNVAAEGDDIVEEHIGRVIVLTGMGHTM